MMKFFDSFLKRTHATLLLTFIFFPNILPATDILYEKDWTRIITGDRATRLTREIGEEPQPATITDETLNLIFAAINFPDQNSQQLDAWTQGLKKNGWAQQETEPEYESYLVIQIIHVSDPVPRLLVKSYGTRGQTSEASFDPEGKQVSYKQIEIPETLDRTVFYTVRSPALFVLNQEHFQKHFFEGMINLDYPGLEAARKAYESKKILLAAHEVAEYFRRKTHPVWPLKYPEKLSTVDKPSEMILRHEFKNADSIIYMGDRVDFRNNPTNRNEWIWGFNRMGHWVTLLDGYLKTGNEAYSREYNIEVVDWTVRNPAPSFRLTRVPSWRNLEAGVRMSSTWPKTFFGFLSSPSFQTQAIQLMLASMWSHGKHILRFPSGMRFVNNWVIIGSNGLASLGMNFPEFRQAEVWTSTGLQRLSDQLDKQVYPDGMQHELSTSYHIACMHSFEQAYTVAQKTETVVPDNFRTTMEKMFEYIMYVSTPAREIPPTNDAHRYNISSWMSIGSDIFNREDMRFIATNGEAGQPPAQVSVHFPWGGHSVMRSDWGPEAWHLFFDAGPTGVSHQHEDKLNIDVSAFGRDFITDGGKGLYIPDKWRSYFLSTGSHNTILIDGQGQRRIPMVDTHRAKEAMTNRWITDSKIDFASGTYKNGYGSQHIPVIHSRYVLFKKKEYWLVLDFLEGDENHQFEAVYHFTPCDIRVNKADHAVQTLFQDGKNIRLTSSATVPVKVMVIEGQENPEQGWISHHSGVRTATPSVIFKGEGQLPVQMATVIEPFQNNKRTDVRIEFPTSPPNQADIIVHAGWGEDRWIINLENKNGISIDGKDTEAAVYFSRFEKGQVIDTFTAKFEK
jgi:hypothetical protein